MKADKAMPGNSEFHILMSKAENKVRMQDFFKNAFTKYAEANLNVELIYTLVR